MKTIKLRWYTKVKWFIVLTLGLYVADCAYGLFGQGVWDAQNILGFGFGGMVAFSIIWYSIANYFSKR